MKRYLVSFVVACISCLSHPAIPRVSAAPSSPAPMPEGERFLFIMDTSSGMERLKDENETTIYQLLRTGMFGQMQTGDTFGLWTYDKETHAGKFPMQVWDARRATQLATITAAYLSDQNYENSDDVKRMIELLTPVVRAARNLNVFIISDGSSSMRGTPFDKAINTEYRKQRRDRNTAKRPFVTTLIARDGSITNYSVVVAGLPIPLPERAVPAAVVATKAPPATNRPAGVLLSITSAIPGAATVTPQQNHAVADTAPTGIAAIPQVSSNAVFKSPTGAPRVIQIITRSNNVSAAIEPNAPEAVKTGAALVSDTTQTNNPAPDLSAPVSPPPANIAVPRDVLTAILPAPVVVAARELHPDPETPNPAPPTTVQAVALPVPSGPGAALFLTFGSLLMAAALFLLFIVHRRLRPAPGGSLITQSMERR